MKEGQVSPTTIKATQTITFENKSKTEEQRKIAEDRIEEVYILDRSILMRMEDELMGAVNKFKNLVNSEAGTKEKIQILQELYELEEGTARALVSLDNDTVESLQLEAVRILESHWQTGVRGFEVEKKKAELYTQLNFLNITVPYKEFLRSCFDKVEFNPNYIKNEEATVRAKQEASRNQGVVMVTIRKGQKIVGEGELVTNDHIEILQALGYKRSVTPYVTLMGIMILIILISVLTNIYLTEYRKDLYHKDISMILLCLICFIILLLAKLIYAVNISSNPEIADMVGYLIPVATGSMLIAILLDTSLAIYATIFLSFLVGILTGNQLSYVINAFVGGLVGIYSVGKFNQRFDWVKAGLFIAIADVVCILALGMMNSYNWSLLLIGCSMGIINGLFSSILAYGSLPFLESAFKITTSVRLLELSNPNQPLLKRLLLEASGTYHHSILVGNLSEAAADAVGADSLLVRVGAYYHDVGKLKRPYFFIENQMGEDNPHEKLSPPLSVLIITSHIKDGVELAHQHKLPSVIIDFIAQHHGTGLVTYFYHKALESDNSENTKEDDYRYNAPKPQTKEVAIIMLADSVEAAVRSMSAPNSGKIEGLVRKIIKERLQDGQLNESDLTFKDLELIANAFTRILSGIFHTRIEYPENVLEAMKGGDAPDEDSNRERTGESGDKPRDGESDSECGKRDKPKV
ncbi:MAG: HDIG domain-containing protein [Clostridia bacterium]|nr:HDIG domain-containing protein [Clostridia bacterium]MDD4047812.1 HDIG domain-containing protein [Clostridia bacterium]